MFGTFQFELRDRVAVEFLSGVGAWEGYIVARYAIKTASGEWVPVYEVATDKYAWEGTGYGDGELTKIEK